MAKLSSHDNSILKALFDPEASPSGAVQIDNNLRPLRHFTQDSFDSIRKEEQTIIRPLNGTSPSQDTVRAVIRDLDAFILRHPDFPSAHINRAQAARLLLSIHDIFTPEYSRESADIFQHLNQGIQLATPASPHEVVSTHQAKLLAAAHTHRGLLLLRAANLAKSGQTVDGAGDYVRNASADQIEELASKDFFAGGRYGDKTAQQLSVKTNPYAKMCGAIVKEAITKEMEEARGLRSYEL
ncbi:hypothetical protein MBLNU459_g7785t1 [Dothideomycetes sp. NU459]